MMALACTWMSVLFVAVKGLSREPATVKAMCLTIVVCVEETTPLALTSAVY